MRMTRAILLVMAMVSLGLSGCGGSDSAGITDPTDGGSTGGGGTGGVDVPTLPPVPVGTVLLSDDMDDENGGVAVQNFSGFNAWTVSDGCVDLHGPGNINPLPGNGLYVDMDGSCMDADTLTSKESFQLPAGSYALEMVLAGNNQEPQADTMDVSVGTAWSTRIILDWQAPFTLERYDFDVGSETTAPIRLEHLGGDEQGILIDAIRLRRTG